MGISVASTLLFCILMDFIFLCHTEEDIYENLYQPLVWSSIYLIVASVILTITFIYFDHIFCCCCQCFLSSKQQIVVHDPNKPDKTFHLVNGEIIEAPEKAVGLRSKFIEMKTRDAVISFSNNLDLTAAETSEVTGQVSQS